MYPLLLFPKIIQYNLLATRLLVLCVCFVDRCLSFCPFSFNLCVVCPSSIYAYVIFKLFYLDIIVYHVISKGMIYTCYGGKWDVKFFLRISVLHVSTNSELFGYCVICSHFLFTSMQFSEWTRVFITAIPKTGVVYINIRPFATKTQNLILCISRTVF